MCDPTRKLSHISLSQEDKFSFYWEQKHFEPHVVPKNVEFSENRNCFIITKMTTLKLLFCGIFGFET